MKHSVELVMFDLDGTLADTGRDLANAVNYTRERFGLAPWPDAAIHSHVGLGVEHLLRQTLPEAPGERFQEIRRVFVRWYEEHLLDNTVLYPHVEEVLERYASKRRVVISNKIERLTVAVLRGLGIDKEFDVIFGAGGQLKKKPDPAMLLAALERFACPGARAVMIGDGATDVRAGKEAGVLTCGVTYGLGRKEDLLEAGAEFLVDDLMQLSDYFG